MMNLLFFRLCLVLCVTHYASASEVTLQLISESEAAAIVQAEEQAKEQAKDAHEANLKSKDSLKTTVIYQGDKRIVFNHVKAEKKSSIEVVKVAAEETKNVVPLERAFFSESKKEFVNLTLSGEVDEDGISEVWWVDEGHRHRIFVQANFLHLTGLGDFEDETHRYSVFSLFTASGHRSNSEKWYPTSSDFTEGELEYLIVEGGNAPEAYSGIEAIIHYLAEHEEALKIKYENSQKLRKARAEYLKSNPPKKRDIILNYTEN